MTNPSTTSELGRAQLSGEPPGTMLALPVVVKDAAVTREQMFRLRHFHLGAPGAGDRLDILGDDFLPALLDPFRDVSRLRYQYPLVLFAAPSKGECSDLEELAQPLSAWLEQAITGFAPEPGAARVLKDHRAWIEHHLRTLLNGREGPMVAAAALEGAGRALQEHLGLKGAEHQQLGQDLGTLVSALPDGALMLGYGRYVALHLLVHVIRWWVVPRRERFEKEVQKCIRGLDELLEVEHGKSDEAIEPRMARDSVGLGGTRFDPLALSTVMDHSRGARVMAPERRTRIEKTLRILESWQPDPILIRFIHAETITGDWLSENPVAASVIDPEPCARATVLFDEQARRLAEIFGAVRVARLEIDRIYDPALHDPWFANFDWEGFSQEELLLVPAVIALESANKLAGPDLRAFSRLLSSGRPVQILVGVQAYNDPGAGPDESPFHHFRTELGYLGMAHRQAVVAQSSPARYEHLICCFAASFGATRTSLHLMSSGLLPPGRLPTLSAWLVAGSAIESRSHPFFLVNPEAGDGFAASMDFRGNPQPKSDWPVHPFTYKDQNGSTVSVDLAYTFADHALLIERLREHFRVIPPSCDSDLLVPLQEYLTMDEDRASHCVPYLLAVDAGGTLHRVAVTRELAHACLDRRSFWRTLQETAGVRNRYVDQAVDRTRAEERSAAAAARERLQAEHAEEVEQVRRSAAGEAMQRLADVLLDLDLDAPAVKRHRVGRTEPPVPAGADEAPSVAEEAAAEPLPEEEAEDYQDPWIDTALCTSCNDCMKINPLLFIYNEEKQASLGDPRSGTYAQLVEAAELCPAKCIHPGNPLNPDEPGLDELLERAAPFNR